MTSRDAQGVIISYPHPEEGVGGRFHRSLINLLAYDAANLGRVMRHGGHAPLSSGAQITKARNKIVEQFLATGIDWLWSIDADMEFEPDTLDRLVKAAHPEKRPIVGGLCFSLIRGDAVEVAPTLYQLAQGRDGFVRQLQYPPDELIQVAGTGAACLLVHRSVFVEMAKKHPKPWPWFAETVFGEDQISEDLTFCLRAGALGYPVHVHTGIKIGHVKPIVIDEGSYISQSMYLAAKAEALAAEAPTFCVVPVVEDTGKQWPENTFVIPNVDGPLNLSAKWNLGLELAEKAAREAGHDKWNVVILNDDLEAGPMFLEQLAGALRSDDDNWIAYPDFRGQVPAGRYQATQSDSLAGQTMSGWAFMVRGESGLRADEQFRWWYSDSDLERRVRDARKQVVAVGGCHVRHLHGTESTAASKELLDMARDDEGKYAAKWGLDPAQLWLALHPEFGKDAK